MTQTHSSTHRRHIARIATDALHSLPTGRDLDAVKNEAERRMVGAFREIALDATQATDWNDEEMALFAKHIQAVAAALALTSNSKCGCDKPDPGPQAASCIQTCINEETECRDKCEGDPDFIGCHSRCALIASFCAVKCILD